MSRLIKKVDGLTNVSYRPIKATQTVFGNPGDQEAFEEVFQRLYEYENRDEPKQVIIKLWNPAYCPSCNKQLSESEGDGYYSHPEFLERCPNTDCNQRLQW